MKTLNKSAIDWTDRQEAHNEVMDLTCVPMRDKNRLCSLPFQGHDDREDCIQQPHLLRLGEAIFMVGLYTIGSLICIAVGIYLISESGGNPTTFTFGLLIGIIGGILGAKARGAL